MSDKNFLPISVPIRTKGIDCYLGVIVCTETKKVVHKANMLSKEMLDTQLQSKARMLESQRRIAKQQEAMTNPIIFVVEEPTENNEYFYED